VLFGIPKRRDRRERQHVDHKKYEKPRKFQALERMGVEVPMLGKTPQKNNVHLFVNLYIDTFSPGFQPLENPLRRRGGRRPGWVTGFQYLEDLDRKVPNLGGMKISRF